MADIYRYQTERDPALAKLAQEAARQLELDLLPDDLEWWSKGKRGGRRIWIWNSAGDFVGSIIVTIEYRPVVRAQLGTIERRIRA
jgi:hypothetical protein